MRSRPSNTRPGDIYVAEGAGLDTIGTRWRGPDAGPILDALSDLSATGGAFRGQGGALCVQPRQGVTVGAYPGVGVAFLEGRLSNLLTGDADDRTLLPAEALRDSQDRLWEVACDAVGAGSSRTPPLGLQRLDTSVDVACESPDGLALLAALAGLDVPRYKVNSFRNGPRTETVNLTTPSGRFVEVIYDKSKEQRRLVPGETVRFEKRDRAPKARQLTPEGLCMLGLGSIRERVLMSARNCDRPVNVGGPEDVGRRLEDLWRAGELSWSEMRRLRGYAAGALSCVPLDRSDQRAEQRDRRRLRELGLSVCELSAPVDVPVGDVLRMVHEALS